MKLVAGNWKMHGTKASAAEIETIRNTMTTEALTGAELLICPPATLVAAFADLAEGSDLMIGGQDCHAAETGAHTGDISAEMLKDAGASHVIVGHSERRHDHGEDDATVRAKADAALRAGLIAILCVGETLEERDAGKTAEVVLAQLKGSVPAGATADRLIIAYEPVWAIGTGRTPTVEQVGETHATIAEHIGKGFRILYGGSVKPGNAAELLAIPHVDGALVGGASLKASDFLQIARAAL